MEESEVQGTAAEPVKIYRKKTFIDEIKNGMETDCDNFQVIECRLATTKEGKPYLAMVFGDRTGRIDARKWDLPDISPHAGAYVRVEYCPGLYMEKLQLKVYRLRILDPAEVAVEDYLPVSKRNRDEMMGELMEWIEQIGDADLRAALKTLYFELGYQLRDAPAAMSKHQPWIGGLVEHTLKLLQLAESLCAAYPTLNRDVMYAGAILHDIGKTAELEYKTTIGYTREGSLTGHIALGVLIWRQYGKLVNPVLRDHVEHIIISHHGKREWGSPNPPMTVEAQLFHFLDMIDSRYEDMTNKIAAGVDDKGMTGWDRDAETRFWNGK